MERHRLVPFHRAGVAMDASLLGSRELEFIFYELLDSEPSTGFREARDIEASWSKLSHAARDAGLGAALDAAVQAYDEYLRCLRRARAGAPSQQTLQHPDVRRHLLAQKAQAEGRLALSLYASSLCEPSRAVEADLEDESRRLQALLVLLKPVIEICPPDLGFADGMRRFLEPLAIPHVELPGQDPHAYGVFTQEVRITLQVAELHPEAHGHSRALDAAIARLDHLVHTVLPQMAKGDTRSLANLSVYLGIVSRIVLAWIWLKQAVRAAKALEQAGRRTSRADTAFYRGKLQAARYYVEWELPLIGPPADLLLARNRTCFDMKGSWFGPKC